jgi:hypothetical protein
MGRNFVATIEFVKTMKKNTKQTGVNHTQEGLGQGSQPAGQVQGEQLRGGGGGKVRNTGACERNLRITLARSQTSAV